jgi:hypothetical protein
MQDLNDKITGGTLTAAEWNEVPSEIQSVIEGLGITLSGGDLNQLGKAIAGYVANGNFYTDSGAADAYVLSVIGSKQRAPSYTDGFEISFIAGNTNNGASTVNVAGLGVKSLTTDTGGVLLSNSIVTGNLISAVYDLSNDRFNIEPSKVMSDKRYSPIFATVAVATAASPVALDGVVADLTVGVVVVIDDYATGNNSGLMFFRVVGPATGTADGGSYIDLANGNQLEQNFPTFISAKLFGAVMDGVTDDRLALFNADAFGPVTLPAGTANIKSALTFTNPVFFAGGGLSIDTAITVTFSNGLTANPDHQIFTGLGTVAGFSDAYLKWWGAKGGDQDSEASGNDSALASMIRYMKTFAQGVEVNAGAGRFRISLGVLIPEKCGMDGGGTTTTFFKAKSGTAFSGAMFENETKTGVGQEFMFLRRMRIDGNRSGGATCEGIRLNQVFVNSTFRDISVTECSSHNIRLVASPDNVALGDGGPIELHNIWSDECGGNTLRVEGDFTVNVYGGAWEDVDAGQDVIHIDGSLFGGTRAVVNFFTPHLEFSNANVRGIFINKGVVSISNAEMVGAQLATQTNIHVEDDDVSTLTINGMKQSSTVRKGVVFNVSGLQVDEAQIGHLSNDAYISTGPHESNGDVGADITLDMNWSNIVSLSAAGATSIADITNAAKDFIALRFSNGNYTIRNNANIKLKKGADFIVPTETTLCFIRINNVFHEISQSA